MSYVVYNGIPNTNTRSPRLTIEQSLELQRRILDPDPYREPSPSPMKTEIRALSAGTTIPDKKEQQQQKRRLNIEEALELQQRILNNIL
jgi:hypothetical protein